MCAQPYIWEFYFQTLWALIYLLFILKYVLLTCKGFSVLIIYCFLPKKIKFKIIYLRIFMIVFVKLKQFILQACWLS